MNMDEKENSQDMNHDFVKNNEVILEKKIRKRKPRRKKITSKIYKNDGPLKATNLVIPKSVRKKEKLGKRQNGRKRKHADDFASETIHPNESTAFKGIDEQNIDGGFSIQHSLKLDNVNSQYIYTHSRIDSTHTCKKFEEEQNLLTPLSRRQLLKKQLESFRRRKSAMSGIQNETFMPTQHISPYQIDLNVALSNNTTCLNGNIKFSSFPKFHKRKRTEKEASSPTIFLRYKILTFVAAHRLITPTMLEMLRNVLEFRRVEVKNKRFDLSFQTFSLNDIESNDVYRQSTTIISAPVKVRQIQEKRAPIEHQELALIPYVHPLSSLEQNLNHDVNKNGRQKSINNHQGALVPYTGVGAMVPYKRQPNRYRLVVALDPKNTWLWNCFACNEQLPEDGTFDYETKTWWENERRIFQGHAESFLAKIRLIQGTTTPK